MPTFNKRVLYADRGALLATSACGGNATVPSGIVAARGASSIVPTTRPRILKKAYEGCRNRLTVVQNGDWHAQSRWSERTSGSKRGNCSFATSTTLQALPGTEPRSKYSIQTRAPKPVTFAQVPRSKAATATQSLREMTSTAQDWSAVCFRRFTQTGKTQRRVTVLPSRFRLPTPTQTAVKLTHLRTSTLGIPRPAQLLSGVPVSSSGHAQVIQVISGFGINTGSGWSVLGPSRNAITIAKKHGSRCNDTLVYRGWGR